MATDAMYGSCIDLTIRLASKAGLPVHAYKYDYRGSNSMLDLLLRMQSESSMNVQHNLPSHEPTTSPSSSSQLHRRDDAVSSILEQFFPAITADLLGLKDTTSSSSNSLHASQIRLPFPLSRLVCHGDELFSLFQMKINGLHAPTQ